MGFIEMKSKDIIKLKTILWKKNKGICPLLKIKVPLEKCVVDHVHKLKSEPYSENKGVCRDSIEFRANALEGKITNNFKRYFGADETKHLITLPEFLRNLADYLEKGSYKDEDGNYWVHPTEVPKVKLLKKQSYAKLKKLYDGRAKFPEYPKSKKISVKLKELYKKYNLEPEFYK